ncbi:C40 family peptidase [Candidatus Pelagibacter sp.]|nr:C40 family peptidase [Candidatus Pelagibacter sp.]
MQNNFYFTGNFSNIYKNPSKKSEVTSQIIHGEKFKILAKNKSWIKIKTIFDNYKGFIKSTKYVKKFSPNFKVSSLKARIFQKPGIKTNSWLPLASKLSIFEQNKNYVKIEKNKWVKKKDIKKLDYKEKNFVKIFKKFINVKYVWGGKTFKGIDCSALLQIFFCYNNSFYPRDTKDQIKYTKKNLKKTKFKKGDIIFWKGHVAMCLNSKQLIHAYGPEKKVIIMPIIETIERIKKTANLKVKKISKIKY